MNIYGTQFVHGPHALSGPHTSKPQQTSTSQQAASTQAKDEVTLSSAAQQASHTTEASASNGEIRFDLVNRLRMEIAAGTYETPEKLDTALEKMLVSIGG
ncbi:MAG: flagellar biosynthesis anti-sigma factor FlgM [Planctomycetaceae bacterium]|nr:flagellar biosynthesis anti-sigma factor FlgM [Planctomycetaceae bacterium]